MVIALLILTVLGFTGQTLFCRLYTQSRDGKGGVQFSVFYAVVTGLCTLMLSGFTYRPSLSTLLLGLVNAGMIFSYNMLLTHSSHLGSYAFLNLCVLSGGILIPMTYDLCYLHASFSTFQWIGVGLMLAAFLLMNADGLKEKKNSKFLLCCLLLFVVNGLYAVIMNLQQTMNQFTQRYEMIVTTFLGMALFTTVGQMAFSRKKFMEGWKMSKKTFLLMLASSLCAALGANLMMYLMKNLNITVLSVVDNGGVLALSALLAFFLFKEKPVWNTILGMSLSVVSMVLLSL